MSLNIIIPTLLFCWFNTTIYRIYLFHKLLFILFTIATYKLISGKFSNYLFDQLYICINQNGCLIIKLVQWTTTRLNIYYENNIPDWLLKFNNFFEHCPIHSIEHSQKIYKKLTGRNISDDYLIDSKIISSGSIGQVYKCKHKITQQEHAIKIKHPDIARDVFIPKTIIITLNNILKHIKFINKYVLPIDFNGFFINLEKQLDFDIESQNMIKMEHLYRNEDLIIIPKVLNHNKDIIIMTFEEGVYIEDISEIKDFNKYKICLLYMLFYHKCSLIDNFNHGDLHRGNWKVRLSENKIDYKLVIYDFGVCYQLKDVNLMRTYIHAWEKYDVNKICDLIYIFYDHLDKDIVKEIRQELFDALNEVQLKPFYMSKYLSLVYNVTTKRGLVLEYSIFNLLISLTLCENMFRKNGFLNRGVEMNDRSGVSVYQELYLEYINFCQTKKCFSDLCQYYKKVIDDSGTKFTKLFGHVNQRLENHSSQLKYNTCLEI